MALVPLYDETAPADSSHRVCAPGGYEAWRLCAYDAKQDLLMTAGLWNGYPQHSRYIRKYWRYRRNPTRIRPPVPGDYACQELAVYQGGKHLAGAVGSLATIESFPDIGAAGLHLSLASCHVKVEPIHQAPPLELTTINSGHHWMLSNPLARVCGELQIATPCIKLPVDAIGCFERRFGGAPIDAEEWIEGFAVFADRALLFQATPTASWLVESTAAGLELVDHPVEATSDARGGFLMRYPTSISLGGVAVLSRARILESSAVRLRVLYEAKSGNEAGWAFCEIFRPRRLRLPLFNLFLSRPRFGVPPLTWSAAAPATPPADKSSPSRP